MPLSHPHLHRSQALKPCATTPLWQGVRTLLWALLAVLWWLPPHAWALEFNASPDHVALSVGHLAVDGKRQHDDGIRVDAALGWRLDNSWDAEVAGIYERLDHPGSPDDQIGGELGLRYRFQQKTNFAPYARGASGIIWQGPGGKFLPFVALGSGFTHPLRHTHWQLRVDIANRQLFDNSAPNSGRWSDWILTVGLERAFKRPPLTLPTAPALPVADPELDTDGDRVPDRFDWCAESVTGSKVNANGCPVDTDMDGVSDILDRCPGTELHRNVDRHGCEPDRDNDGHIDRLDRCPDSRDVVVDAHGCAVVKVIILKGVRFHFDSDRLTATARELLAQTAITLKAHRDILVEVAGHTDARGSEAYNLTLSQRRTESVVRYLVQSGVPKAMLMAKGYGETEPLASNGDASGRAQNRRVALRVMTLKTPR